MHLSPVSSGSKTPNGMMKLINFSNEFPHINLQELFRRIHTHSKSKQHTFLAAFVDETTAALKEEIRLLPQTLKSLIPPFETILTLVDHAELRKGPLGGAIEGLLLCLVELGTLIGYFEDHPKEYDLDGLNSCLVGMGIGLLASSAVSLSSSIPELPLAGAAVTRIAFRLGVLVDEISQNLEPRDMEAPESWAWVVAETTEGEVQKELDAIQSKQNIPEPSKIFISAAAKTSVTVSGPPSRLKAIFRESEFLRYSKHITAPVFGGLCHAKHIYSKEHIEKIVRTASLQKLEDSRRPLVPIMSTSTGRRYSVSGTTELLESIVGELLTSPIRWDNVIDGVVDHANDIGASNCKVMAFQVSAPTQDLVSTLESDSAHLKVETHDIVQWVIKESEENSRGTLQSKIAIVGMACRFPGEAIDPETYWKVFESGRDCHQKIPADRFDVETHYDSEFRKTNASWTPYGCFIDNPGMFDAPFFNMSPREAQQTDPMHRIALITAYEALERSGYIPNRTAAENLHRIGTFYGQASDDYREVNTAQEIGTYFITGGCRAFAPGRINYFFKFSGPSFNCDTACSSSLATIQIACTSLWAGDVDMVVAGGLNVLTNSDAFAGLSYGHFLSKTGGCKTWDSEADGYCRADGVGSIVLKRLEDAERDNDNILGVVLAAATNHSAEAISITHPHAGAQSELYQQVVNRAGIDPLSVDYVEMHGTGTQAGDLVEIKSITDIFAPTTKRRGPKNPLYIGAAKSNVGHGEAAAGIMALIKVLCMLQKNVIPPHIGIQHGINPGFPKDLDKRNLRIAFEKTSWPQVPGKKRIAIINNFSAAGGNTTLALEEAPSRDIQGVDSRPYHVVAVSAKSKLSLKGNIEHLLAYIESNPEISLADLSYTTTSRRVHHNFRVAVGVSDVKQLHKLLAPHAASSDTHRPIPITLPSVAFAFTGQGAFYKKMSMKLFKENPTFHSSILHLVHLSKIQGYPSIIPALDGSVPDEHEFSPVVIQLTIVCVEIALAKLWESWGIKPSVVIGSSLGEYSALHVAGVLSASDTIFLVGERAKCLEKACTIGSHHMMAVCGTPQEVKQAANGLPYELACINTPKNLVLCGTKKEMDAIEKEIQPKGHKCHKLDVPYAFHSSQMEPALEAFAKVANHVVYKPVNIPVISPLLGKVIYDEKTINAKYIVRATREPVNFVGAINTANEFATIDDKTVWIEVGPHPVCIGFVKNTLPSVNAAVPSLRRDQDNWATMATSLSALHCAGLNIDWIEFNRPFEHAHRLLDLPTYAWNEKNYWLPYNGTWALTKGNSSGDVPAPTAPIPIQSSLRSSTIHQVLEEEIGEAIAKVVVQSDIQQGDFYSAVKGHTMNGCGVATSSIHADVAFTLGEYLYNQLQPHVEKVYMNITNLVVTKGLVAQKSKKPQLIRVAASADLETGTADICWYPVEQDGQVGEMFASAVVEYGDHESWLAEWARSAHLVKGRLEALQQQAIEGKANRLSRNLIYRLFNNLVDYSEKYRGMHSVILNEMEAMADVVLSTDKSGTYNIPPHYIDSVAHIAGFIMNGSDALDSKTNFFVTPGWDSMRFAKRLVPGGKYQSYVKMIPTGEPGFFDGDVYILQDGIIIGMVGNIHFRQYPRTLLNRFFSASDANDKPSTTILKATKSQKAASVPIKTDISISKPKPKLKEVSAVVTRAKPVVNDVPAAPAQKQVAKEVVETVKAERPVAVMEVAESILDVDESSIVYRALSLVANEAALELSELADDAAFTSLGIDSLMSLVIAEKFRQELDIEVVGSLFLNCPTIGELKTWLLEYC